MLETALSNCFHSSSCLSHPRQVAIEAGVNARLGGSMHSLANDYAAGLLTSHDPPCLSLYQPTHRHYPDNSQDPIRYRNLIKSMEESLQQKYTNRISGRSWSRFTFSPMTV